MPTEKLSHSERAEAAVNAFADQAPQVKVRVTAEHGIQVSGHPPLAKGAEAYIDVAIAKALASEGSVEPA